MPGYRLRQGLRASSDKYQSRGNCKPREHYFAELCICRKLQHWGFVSGHGFNSLLLFGFVKNGWLKFCEYARSAYSICRNFYEDISLIGVLELSCFIAVAECARRFPLATFFTPLMKTRNEIVFMTKTKIRLRHFSYSTEQSYCGWIARYYDYCLRLPKQWPQEKKAETFLSHLALQRQLSARTQNQALSALLFLYTHVLHRPLGNINAMRARQPLRERTSPSREQMRALREALVDRPSTPVKLLVDLLYGCGLRVCEPLDLRIKDVLWEENQLLIRNAKGNKDRRVPIPAFCLEPLRAQMAIARQVWESDRKEAPSVGVSLPFQLAKKYPSYALSWQWFWIFPAASHCQDPRSDSIVRYRLLEDQLQRAVRAAAIKVGLEGLVTPHVIRHAYATHSRENIETLRELMGHNSIKTTAGYKHPLVEKATNPLDDLLKRPAAA